MYCGSHHSIKLPPYLHRVNIIMHVKIKACKLWPRPDPSMFGPTARMGFPRPDPSMFGPMARMGFMPNLIMIGQNLKLISDNAQIDKQMHEQNKLYSYINYTEI